MVNFKAKTAKENKREKGIALIFTLIMLSLLLILALSFALDSMFEQKAAYNSANASAANLAAKTELNQLLSFLQYGEPDFSNSTVYSIGPYEDNESPPQEHYDRDMLVNGTDYPSLLLTDGLITTSNIDSLCFGASNDDHKISWTYHKDDTGKIIGRTAFVVIPQEKISLDSLVDGRVGTAEYPKHNETDDTETRIGKYVSEINVRTVIPNVTNNIGTITDTLNWKGDPDHPDTNPGFPNGEYTGTWSSYDSLFSALETAISRDLTQTEKDDFKNNLSIDSTKDSEAFWVDLDNDNSIDSDAGADVNNPVAAYELYKRFDLTRDWVTSGNDNAVKFIKEKILLTNADPDSNPATDNTADKTPPDFDMEKWTPVDSNTNSKGLPWLATFGYKTDGTEDSSLSGTFTNVQDRRYQIAANLKDYCDSDSKPTSDVDPTTWKNVNTVPAPTYTGNEKTPYIDKIGMKVNVLQFEDEDGGTYDVSAHVTLTPHVSLVNMYDTSSSKFYTIYVKGIITIKTKVAGADNPTTQDHEFDCDMNIGPSDWPNSGYSVFQDDSIPAFLSGTQTGITGSRHVDFEITKLQFTKVVLTDVSTGYDYAQTYAEYDPDSTDYIKLSLNAGASSSNIWYGFAAHDPRQNLNTGDWKTLTPQMEDPTLLFSLTGTSAPYGGAPNATGPLPTDLPNGTNCDLEKDITGNVITDPANKTISTAYIRNAKMESPWELGFIHRGAKWQTINLKKYDASKAYSAISTGSPAKYYLQGGGAYADGDANILDQIKMTASYESPAKINIATSEEKILDALFSKIYLGCGIDHSTMDVPSIAKGSGTKLGTEINLTDSTYTGDPNGLRTKILNKFKTFTTNNQTRSCVADDMTAFTAATNDAEQEELIGKTINLVKINKTPGDGNYSIIVVSQTIKDVGGDGTDIKIYKTPADGTDAQEVNCRLGRFDVTGASANWKNNAYGDDITATQKVLIKTSKVNDKIKVTSFKYVD